MYYLGILLLLGFTAVCNGQARVKNIDTLVTLNSKAHHTENFNVNGALVLRRGATFDLKVELTKPFDAKRHTVTLQFFFGRFPTVQDGSLVSLFVQPNRIPTTVSNRWSANLESAVGTSLNVKVSIAANAPVGSWKYSIVVTEQGFPQPPTFKYPLYILFNPWSKLDEVYYPDEVAREDYVLNDVGKVFMGTSRAPDAREWIHGQFKKGVLEAIMFILEKSRLRPGQRSSAVAVVADLSALVNSQDDKGVLYGRWSEPYEPFKAPWEWTGSAEILLQYHRTNGQPVKYGQCWVFASVLSTMCRAIGIPSRMVTNYESAHDTDADLMITRYFDQNENAVSKLSRDSIWNFHVWTEVWMSRADLNNSAYDGWQAIDGTPQEPSGGIFKTGPSPVNAIKHGVINMPFDTQFIYAEVNADLYDYLLDSGRNLYVPLPANTNLIGAKIITQKAGQLGRDLMSPNEDLIVTHEYKFREGTREERLHYRNASNSLYTLKVRPEAGPTPSGTPQSVPPPPPRPVMMPARRAMPDIQIESQTGDKVLIGQPLKLAFLISNHANQKRNVELVVNVSSVYYTGNTSAVIKTMKIEMLLEGNGNQTVEMVVPPGDYIDKLVEFSLIQVMAVARSNESGNIVANKLEIKLNMPSLVVEVNGQPKMKIPFKLAVEFTNPLRIKLEECKLNIESRNYGPKSIELRDIQAEEKFIHIEDVLVEKQGKDTFVTNLRCKKLSTVSGKLEVLIEE